MKLGEAYKALSAGLTALAGMEFLVTVVANASDRPWAQATSVGLAALVGAATFFVKNKTTFDQIERALEGDDEVTQQVIEKVAAHPEAVAAAVKQNVDLAEQLIAEYKSK